MKMNGQIPKIIWKGMISLVCIGLLLTNWQCKEKSPPIKEEKLKGQAEKIEKNVEKNSSPAPKGWTEITQQSGILLDIRYATKDNFTKQQIYDCPRCFVRPDVAKSLLKIQAELKEKYGYGLKMFDCFRPRPYQQRLWDIVPNPSYVTPPRKGSMHSRGMAVDLTIVDKNGKELDMGTEYDFFGKEAHQDFKDLSPEVTANRKLLKSIMEKHQFAPIRTEWWHYSYQSNWAPLDDWVWNCE